MNYAINPFCQFPALPLGDALALARAEGVDHFEWWGLKDGDEARLAEAMRATGARLVDLCTDCMALNDPARRDEFLSSLQRALAAAKRLGAPFVITQAGQDDGSPRGQQHERILQSLRAAAPLAERAGIALLLEPLNDVRDHVGTYLTSSEEGLELVRAAESLSIRLLFDVYHQLQMGEDVGPIIEHNARWIAHFHIAGLPGRDERLFDGAADFDPILRLIARLNTPALVGLEFFPGDGFDALATFRRLNAYR